MRRAETLAVVHGGISFFLIFRPIRGKGVRIQRDFSALRHLQNQLRLLAKVPDVPALCMRRKNRHAAKHRRADLPQQRMRQIHAHHTAAHRLKRVVLPLANFRQRRNFLFQKMQRLFFIRNKMAAAEFALIQKLDIILWLHIGIALCVK